jgi:hypothetical protein
MAAIAQRDQQKRTVEVDRIRLINILTENRQKHIADYDEAMAGYRATLLNKVRKAFEQATTALGERQAKLEAKIAGFTDEDISKQRDHLTLVDAVTVEMKVPRSYVEEYDAAIDMARHDVRTTLELTHAEFTCFVRDRWDWKSDFDAISAIYKS